VWSTRRPLTGPIIGLDNNEATYPSRIGRYIYIFTPYLFMFMWFMDFYPTSSATGSLPPPLLASEYTAVKRRWDQNAVLYGFRPMECRENFRVMRFCLILAYCTFSADGEGGSAWKAAAGGGIGERDSA
jgi:hypothetical protein